MVPIWVQKYVIPAVLIAYIVAQSFIVGFALYASRDAKTAAHDACVANNHTNSALVAEVDSAYARSEASTIQLLRDPHLTPDRRQQLQDNLDNSHATQLRIHTELAVNSCG